jgi:hypothetical protein
MSSSSSPTSPPSSPVTPFFELVNDCVKRVMDDKSYFTLELWREKMDRLDEIMPDRMRQLLEAMPTTPPDADVDGDNGDGISSSCALASFSSFWRHGDVESGEEDKRGRLVKARGAIGAGVLLMREEAFVAFPRDVMSPELKEIMCLEDGCFLPAKYCKAGCPRRRPSPAERRCRLRDLCLVLGDDDFAQMAVVVRQDRILNTWLNLSSFVRPKS